jgi:hypothetical protein
MKKVIVLLVSALFLASMSSGSGIPDGFKLGEDNFQPWDYSSMKTIEQEDLLAALIRGTVAKGEKNVRIPVKGLKALSGGAVLKVTFLLDKKPRPARGMDDHMVLISVLTKDPTLGSRDKRRMQTTYKAHVWVTKDGKNYTYNASLLNVVEVAWDR